MSVEDQQKRYEELAEKFVLLDVPMIVDRSADEEKDDVLKVSEIIKYVQKLFL